MGKFKKDRRFDGNKPAKHKATCDKCGIDCEVPFRPTGDRPVFCSNCFKNQDGGGRPNKFSDKRRERSNFVDKQKYDVVCTKCGKDCQVPFKPTSGKPVFCDNCFKQDDGRNNNSGDITEQINLLNTKIDKLMEILTNKEPKPAEKTKKPKIKKETVKKKTVKEKKQKTKAKTTKSKK